MPYNFLKNLLLLVAATVLSTGFINCKENPVPPIVDGEDIYQWPADTIIEDLYNQPLEVIQKYTYGKWKVLWMGGG